MESLRLRMGLLPIVVLFASLGLFSDLVVAQEEGQCKVLQPSIIDGKQVGKTSE